MALDLIKRFKTSNQLFAVEKISLAYNLFTTVLICIFFQEMSRPVEMLAGRATIVVLTFVLAYLYRFAPNKLSTFVRIAAQMGLLAYWYPDTFEFNRMFFNLDHVFAHAEQALFGCQPAVLFSDTFPTMWASEPFNFGYFSYYPLIFIVTLFYFINRFEWFEKISFVLVASFLIYYIIYIFVPVAGPQFYFPAIGWDNVQNGIFPAIGDYFSHHTELLPAPGYEHGFFYQLVEHSQQVGERPTAAFPSSHVGISTIVMLMAYRINKHLFRGLLPVYLLLCGATVYIQAHYFIDVIGGLISGVSFYILNTWIYKRWFRHPLFKDLEKAK